MLRLAHGLAFADLYSTAGAARIDGLFLAHLDAADAPLAARLREARSAPDALGNRAEGDLLIALGPHLEDFVATLFGIQDDVRALEAAQHELAPLYAVKRMFVQRKAMNAHKAEAAAAFDGPALRAALEARIGAPIAGRRHELAFANAVTAWQKDEAANAEPLDLATRYAAWAAHTPEGRADHRDGVLFRAPRKLDVMKLVPVEPIKHAGVTAFELGAGHLREREGFALTDPGTDLVGGLDQAHYCIICHEQGKDSCSRGLPEKKAADGALPEVPFRKSPFGVTLAGCPLEERISEFHKLRADGWAIGALATICVDNPIVAGTGHRICNDCMKSCIYQKQDPVDIPQSETRVLKDVLALPWGFEVYSLLTRWNPLDLRRPVPREATGRRVLVVGLGPAGFTLAHHLMNDGHTVAAIDGLKIEPLPAKLSGVALSGERVPFEPVRDYATLVEPLGERVMAGFGGVAEYGITVRWDKNFLKVIRLLLERRAQFALYGGVRFGGTVTVEDAFAMGFDHVALAAGAGKPTVLELPNGLATGVRTASDFLMALQLTGAAKADSLANMQVRMPVVVVGGGLTAIDTATESLAYYPVQVEKFLSRHEALVREHGREAVEREWSPQEREIADEFLTHARSIRAERAAARSEGRAARIVPLLRSWGGATIAYRRLLVDSPSYTLNHEEVEKALEEGILFSEGLTPLAIEVDAHGHASGLSVSAHHNDGDGVWHEYARTTIPARTILIAAGTQPNTVLAREDAGHFGLDGKYFRLLDEDGAPVKPVRGLAKPAKPAVLTSIRRDGRATSFFGDLHPSFHGNVVKAMASAKQGYGIVSRTLARAAPASSAPDAEFFARLDRDLRATVERVERLTPTIVEVVVRAPAAARNFRPGQFYRLQNYETLAAVKRGTRMTMEGLALTGAWVDRDRGLVSTIVLEMGGSSDLCAALKPGEPVVLMGPTGAPTEIEPGENVVLVGGGLGNAVLFSIGQAFRAAGSKVLYFAGYKKMIDRYKVADIEAAADAVVWCSDEPPGFVATRPQDRAFVGNIVQGMVAYAGGGLGAQPIPFDRPDRIIAIGSDKMMAAVAAARHTVLAPYMKPGHEAIGSINSPMQCMMKEICAQCLQPHKDPATGKVSYVFSCFNQDQPLDLVDFSALDARLKQNSVQEKLTAQWIALCERERKVRAAAD
ncbi:Dihydroorotate dehydrogenase B (NAD(+)), electron transfer subunit [Burkholderiales bacterium]|nr:Dihydroorotate dehydrogenase B (NAD(+)), electron transfer subunit [Burkholderiales bacterium]